MTLRRKKKYLPPQVFSLAILCLIGLSAAALPSVHAAVAVIQNDTGTFVDGEQVSEKIYNATVCMSGSVAQDSGLPWTCQRVCRTTDTDCFAQVNYGLNSKGNVLFKSYSVNGFPVTVNSTQFLTINNSQTYIDAYGAVINLTFSQENSQNGIRASNKQDVWINGLKVISNNSCGTSCQGMSFGSVQNFHLNDVNVTGIEGFQIVFNGNSKHNFIDGSYVYGSGTNDVIGGGATNNATDTFMDLHVTNSKIIQDITGPTSVGYSFAIDIVGCNGCSFDNNFIKGTAAFGRETWYTQNSRMTDNYIEPAIGANNATLWFVGTDNLNNYADGNVVTQGRIVINGATSTVTNNWVLNATESSQFNGRGTFIGGNHFFCDIGRYIGPTSGYVVRLLHNETTFAGNKVYGCTGSLSIEASDNDVGFNDFYDANSSASGAFITVAIQGSGTFDRDNNNIHENTGYLRSGRSAGAFIYVGTNNTGTAVAGNKFFNAGTLTRMINVGGSNATLSDNRVIGDQPVTALIGFSNESQNYAADYTYSVLPACGTSLPTNELQLRNSTGICVCSGGTWQCTRYPNINNTDTLAMINITGNSSVGSGACTSTSIGSFVCQRISTTPATTATYGQVIQTSSSGALLGFGVDANYGYLSSLNAKPLQINNPGNNVLILGQGNANATVGTLTANTARLTVNSTFRIVAQSAAPAAATLGSFYVDSDTNELCFGNSTAFVGLQGRVCA